MGLTLEGSAPRLLRVQLEAARGGGVDVPQGASTEELMELMTELIGDGFIGFAP